MARNIEIKARVDNMAGLIARVAAIADQGPIEIAQDDTFFRCESGRLKLRSFADGSGELIFYRRANLQGPKESFYERVPTSAPDALRDCLTLAYGQAGRVRKQRLLYLVGRTRVHLDTVDQLGCFLELEVVMAEEEPADSGVREAQDLMISLGVAPEHLINDAYVDLLAKLSTISAQHTALPASFIDNLNRQ